MEDGNGDQRSIRQRAREAGVSPATMMRRVRAEGGDQDGRTVGADGRARPAHRTDTAARDARIRELRADGATMRAIAQAVGVSVGTVHRTLGQDPTPDGQNRP